MARWPTKKLLLLKIPITSHSVVRLVVRPRWHASSTLSSSVLVHPQPLTSHDTTLTQIQATGTLGTSILSALRAANFNITVLTRSGSTSCSKVPESTRVITADYASHESLVSAFKGADAVVSALGRLVIPAQKPLIDAAVDAGVQRFIPSEYGGDTFDEKVRVMPGLQQKAIILDHLAKLAEDGKIEWTAIMTGPFLDWGQYSPAFY
jgi:putative NADH-flavin reductase